MDILDKMKGLEAYTSNHIEMPNELQHKAVDLCWQYNNTHPHDRDTRSEILNQLLGTKHPMAHFKSPFQCDYGFNIHTQGFVMANYNCIILDTSPVIIGNGVFIAPNVCLACSGHAIDSVERIQGYGTSAPIIIEDEVWIGANVTVLGGVTIGKGSIIGAGSVVTKDIPKNVIAAGSPCKVLRNITDEDKLQNV